MNGAASRSHCHPFFLEAAQGQRFCVYFPPQMQPCQGYVLHIHAFAEEMNKARRMVALQARAFSRIGLGVLLIDLYGCGDSSGDFGDARWDIWKADIGQATAWLRRRGDAPVILWGLRLGSLLLLDYARGSLQSFSSFIMWQPVTRGDTFLTQFLRLRLANDMLTGQAKTGTKELRASLQSGHRLQVGGYDIAPELARAMDNANLADLGIPGSRCHWFEVATGDSLAVSPASQRVIERWRSLDMPTDTHVVPGEPFWVTQEITECHPLITATSSIFSGQSA